MHQHSSNGGSGGVRLGKTYAGARVVFRKVDLQMLHWMSLACSLTLSCDLATPFSSLSLRARFEAAFAPCLGSVSLVYRRKVGAD
jgi:hypothetical protein